MVERANGRDGTTFLGCSTFPACRGTRPLVGQAATGRPVRRRHQLWGGGRPKTWGDDVELIAARALGHSLNAWQSLLLRLALIVLVFILFVNLIGPVSRLFGQYMGDAFRNSIATPRPSPSG